jgi:hypothetical protein
VGGAGAGALEGLEAGVAGRTEAGKVLEDQGEVRPQGQGLDVVRLGGRGWESAVNLKWVAAKGLEGPVQAAQPLPKAGGADLGRHG